MSRTILLSFVLMILGVCSSCSSLGPKGPVPPKEMVTIEHAGRVDCDWMQRYCLQKCSIDLPPCYDRCMFEADC